MWVIGEEDKENASSLAVMLVGPVAVLAQLHIARLPAGGSFKMGENAALGFSNGKNNVAFVPLAKRCHGCRSAVGAAWHI